MQKFSDSSRGTLSNLGLNKGDRVENSINDWSYLENGERYGQDYY